MLARSWGEFRGVNESRVLLETFRSADRAGLRAALATVIRVEGSSYRRAGAKMLIVENGELAGAVSGGCLERDLIDRARRSLVLGRPERVVYDTHLDRPEGVAEREVSEETALEIGPGIVQAGLGCEGIIEIYIEPEPRAWIDAIETALRERRDVTFVGPAESGHFCDTLRAPVRLVQFGAGHDAIAMSRLACELGWDVTVVDCRSSFPQPGNRFSHVDRFIRATPGSACKSAAVTANDVVIVMTHHRDHDRAIVADLVRILPRYVGLLGPRVRADRILAELEIIERPSGWYAPVGLDLGAEGPEAIALATLAEIVAVLSKKSARSLSALRGPIHDRTGCETSETNA